ncbi:MAG: hypothetical protein GY810_00985 [Aureispira sp.]|nr:hypothetical protein [Aureispira sp.]
MCCKIANIVVVGGVRRSALIGLSNPTDDRIRVAKQGNWSIDNPQRALANNSAAYTEKPDFAFFLKEWISLYESKSGERGMFSRVASQKKAAENGRRDASYEFGTNPCCEIILRPKGFCNLTEVVIREHDTLEDLKNKVRLATIIGTFQSTLVDFKYLCQEWVDNAKEERLLGVSFTGIMDHSVMSGSEGKGILEEWLNTLRIHAIQTNKTWAHKLGIPQSAAVTCVKPSGTVSQLVDSASGIHFRFAKHYIRRVRGDIKDPLTEFMMDNIPWEMDNMVPGMVVFEFPQKAPKHSITVGDRDALYQLEIWKVYYDNWCEHKPSITVYYKDNEEFMRVGAWLYENFDECSGVSFLPVAEHIYSQAPYEEISEVVYNAMKSMEPEFNWASLTDYEEIDNTKGVGELACTGSVCEIVDI